MKTVNISSQLKRLVKLSDEIRYRDFFKNQHFTSGIIAFRSHGRRDGKEIQHADKDVVCHVIKGHGRLRVGTKRIALGPGTLCHIPRGTPHDFAAGRNAQLILLYTVIETKPE